MIDAVPEKRVVKINATIDDDINLILDAIIKVDSAFVILVLPEGNDLANSPIGLKALRRKTLEKAKRMVLVVPKGSAYDLAKKAGFIASASQEAVTGDVWQTVTQQYDEYKQSQAGMNSRKELPHHIEKKVEYMASSPDGIPVPEIIMGGGKKVVEEEELLREESKPREQVKHVEPPEAPTTTSPRERLANQNITGMDFSKLVRKGGSPSFFGTPRSSPMTSQTVNKPQEINSFHPDFSPKKVGTTLGKMSQKKEVSPFVRFLLFGFIGAGIAAIGIFVAYYFYFPKVRIELKIQSNALSHSDIALATSAVTGFDVNRKEIQMTKERIEKNGSQSFIATEVGSDGTKSTGEINAQSVVPITLTAGTLITVKGRKFTVVTQVVVNGPTNSVPLSSVDFGEDNNILACAVSCDIAIPKTGVEGTGNSVFNGGTTRTFKVVGQKDVDKATKELQTELAKQAEADLSYMNLDKGFEFIKTSVKTELKGKVTVSPAVGAEVKENDEEPAVSMFINTSALYYHAESLSKLAESLLLSKYKVEKSLSAEDAARTSIEQLAVKVDKIILEKDDKVTLNFSATGLATARLDIEQIRNDVARKKWPEMLSYLTALPALAQTPEVTFYPLWLPVWSRYVPGEISRIDVGVKVISPEAPVTTTVP